MDNNTEEAHIKKLISLAGSLRNAMEFRLCNGYPRARFTTSRCVGEYFIALRFIFTLI